MQAGTRKYVLCQCSEHGKAAIRPWFRGKKIQNTWHQKSPSAFMDINVVFHYHLMNSCDLLNHTSPQKAK